MPMLGLQCSLQSGDVHETLGRQACFPMQCSSPLALASRTTPLMHVEGPLHVTSQVFALHVTLPHDPVAFPQFTVHLSFVVQLMSVHLP